MYSIGASSVEIVEVVEREVRARLGAGARVVVGFLSLGLVGAERVSHGRARGIVGVI